jgi:response regulator of citrate/malate metabolism
LLTGRHLSHGCAQARKISDAPVRAARFTRQHRNDFESVEQALMLGAVDYITKPFTVDYLEETVDSKIATHLMYA